jgi:hypothetical protein
MFYRKIENYDSVLSLLVLYDVHKVELFMFIYAIHYALGNTFWGVFRDANPVMKRRIEV